MVLLIHTLLKNKLINQNAVSCSVDFAFILIKYSFQSYLVFVLPVSYSGLHSPFVAELGYCLHFILGFFHILVIWTISSFLRQHETLPCLTKEYTQRTVIFHSLVLSPLPPSSVPFLPVSCRWPVSLISDLSCLLLLNKWADTQHFLISFLYKVWNTLLLNFDLIYLVYPFNISRNHSLSVIEHF